MKTSLAATGAVATCNSAIDVREGLKKINSGIFHSGGWGGSAVDQFSGVFLFVFKKI